MNNEELDRIRQAAQAHAEGIHSVLTPVLQAAMEEFIENRRPTPEELRKHWRYVFAASAMQGFQILNNPNGYAMNRTWTPETIAKACREMADALLAELEKTK